MPAPRLLLDIKVLGVQSLVLRPVNLLILACLRVSREQSLKPAGESAMKKKKRSLLDL